MINLRMNIKRTTSLTLAGIFLVFASLALVCPMQVNAMVPLAHNGCGSLPSATGMLGASMDCIQSHLFAYHSTIAPLSSAELVLALTFAVLVFFVVYQQLHSNAEENSVLPIALSVHSNNLNQPIFLLKMQRWFVHCVANKNTSAN